MSFMKHFNTRGAYTVEELFNHLKNYTFSAGAPNIGTTGGNPSIVFPPIDEFNQIWVVPSGINPSGRWQRWCVMKSVHKPGLDNMMVHSVLGHFAPVTTGTLSYLSTNAQKGYELIDVVAAEISNLNL